MTDLLENPVGEIDIEFVEFACLVPGVLEPIFEAMGFSRLAVHRSKNMVLYRQGDINFIVNNDPDSVTSHYAAEHGPSACGMALRMSDAHGAYARAIELGAFPIDICTAPPVALHLPALQGIGGASLYLVDRTADRNAVYENSFEFIAEAQRNPDGHGLTAIDHLTHHVFGGRLSYWAGLYGRLFNMSTMRYVDMMDRHAAPSFSGAHASLKKSLLYVKGEGIQHIALLTGNLHDTVVRLREALVLLHAAPGQAYEDVAAAPQDQQDGGPSATLIEGTDVDGRPHALLQICSASQLGPMLFELIQHSDDAIAGPC